MIPWLPFIVSKCEGHTGLLEVQLSLIRNPALGGFTPREDLVLFVQEAEWVSRPVRTASKISPPPGSEPRTVQPLASRYTGYDILDATYC